MIMFITSEGFAVVGFVRATQYFWTCIIITRLGLIHTSDTLPHAFQPESKLWECLLSGPNFKRNWSVTAGMYECKIHSLNCQQNYKNNGFQKGFCRQPSEELHVTKPAVTHLHGPKQVSWTNSVMSVFHRQPYLVTVILNNISYLTNCSMLTSC